MTCATKILKKQIVPQIFNAKDLRTNLFFFFLTFFLSFNQFSFLSFYPSFCQSLFILSFSVPLFFLFKNLSIFFLLSKSPKPIEPITTSHTSPFSLSIPFLLFDYPSLMPSKTTTNTCLSHLLLVSGRLQLG